MLLCKATDIPVHRYRCKKEFGFFSALEDLQPVFAPSKRSDGECQAFFRSALRLIFGNHLAMELIECIAILAREDDQIGKIRVARLVKPMLSGNVVIFSRLATWCPVHGARGVWGWFRLIFSRLANRCRILGARSDWGSFGLIIPCIANR